MNDESEQVDYDKIRKEILDMHNKIRADPKSFIPVLENHLKMFKDKVYYYPNKIGMMTNEGTAGVKEAIQFLKAQKALGKLEMDNNLCKAADDHAKDIGPKGILGHEGSDGSSVSDRVERYCAWKGGLCENIDYGVRSGEMVILALLVDDGVKSRGHRKNLFNEGIKYAGIACGFHEKYGMLSVCDYTNGVSGKSVISKKVEQETYCVKEVSEKMQKMALNDNSPVIDKKQVISGGLKQEKYSMSTDPDCPKGAVGSSVSVSQKTSCGITTTVTKKTYTMKDGSKKTIELTSTTTSD